MNDRQRDYFRAKLLAWKDEILRNPAYPADAAGRERQPPGSGGPRLFETDRAIELAPRPPAQADLKIDAALQRIDDNTYGYCEETGEPISLKRLEARPIATLSVEARSATRNARRSIATSRCGRRVRSFVCRAESRRWTKRRGRQTIAAARRNRTPLNSLGAEIAPQDEPRLPGSSAPCTICCCRISGAMVGYKIGCASAVMQQYLDIPHPCGGGVFARACMTAAPRCAPRLSGSASNAKSP
jgi:DnaK suppressor protein